MTHVIRMLIQAGGALALLVVMGLLGSSAFANNLAFRFTCKRPRV